jgi:hypothetical protein
MHCMHCWISLVTIRANTEENNLIANKFRNCRLYLHTVSSIVSEFAYIFLYSYIRPAAAAA